MHALIGVYSHLYNKNQLYVWQMKWTQFGFAGINNLRLSLTTMAKSFLISNLKNYRIAMAFMDNQQWLRILCKLIDWMSTPYYQWPTLNDYFQGFGFLWLTWLNHPSHCMVNLHNSSIQPFICSHTTGLWNGRDFMLKGSNLFGNDKAHSS